MRTNETERQFLDACLERGAYVAIEGNMLVITNPTSLVRNTQHRPSNTQTFDTPARAAQAVCENLGL